MMKLSFTNKFIKIKCNNIFGESVKESKLI